MSCDSVLCLFLPVPWFGLKCVCSISCSFAVSTCLLVSAKLGDVAADRLFIYSNAWCMQAFGAMSKLGG